MVAAAESVNVVDFAPIAGHVAARVRAAAIFGPDVVPTPARCHNGIWAGVEIKVIPLVSIQADTAPPEEAAG